MSTPPWPGSSTISGRLPPASGVAGCGTVWLGLSSAVDTGTSALELAGAAISASDGTGSVDDADDAELDADNSELDAVDGSEAGSAGVGRSPRVIAAAMSAAARALKSVSVVVIRSTTRRAGWSPMGSSR